MLMNSVFIDIMAHEFDLVRPEGDILKVAGTKVRNHAIKAVTLHNGPGFFGDNGFGDFAKLTQPDLLMDGLERFGWWSLLATEDLPKRRSLVFFVENALCGQIQGPLDRQVGRNDPVPTRGVPHEVFG